MKANHPHDMHNVEKSFFEPGIYIGYDGRGHRWKIAKHPTKANHWRAVPANNHPGRLTALRLMATTLRQIAAQLEARV